MLINVVLIPFVCNLFLAWYWVKNMPIMVCSSGSSDGTGKYTPSNTRILLFALTLGICATVFGYFYGVLVVGISIVSLINFSLTPTVIFLVVMFGWIFTVFAMMIFAVVMDLLSRARNKVRSVRPRVARKTNHR